MDDAKTLFEDFLREVGECIDSDDRYRLVNYSAAVRGNLHECLEAAIEYPTILTFAFLGQLRFDNAELWMHWYEADDLPLFEAMKRELRATDAARELIEQCSLWERVLQLVLLVVFRYEHQSSR